MDVGGFGEAGSKDCINEPMTSTNSNIHVIFMSSSHHIALHSRIIVHFVHVQEDMAPQASRFPRRLSQERTRRVAQKNT